MPTLSSPPAELVSYLHRSDRGQLRMWLAAPSVLLFKYKGHSDAGYLPFIEQVYNDTLDALPGRTYIFVDCEDQTGYDPEFRRGIIEWSKRVVPRTHTYVLFVRSRLVAVGVAVARVLVGGVARHAEVVTEREAFRAKLEVAVQRSLSDHPS